MATKYTLTSHEVEEFQNIVFGYYSKHARNLAWRDVNDRGFIDPYHVTVSEIMLQQTQVKRVEQKYIEFIGRFPTLNTLAEASLPDVLRIWSGLGYNRRAKYLHDFAKSVIKEKFPTTVDELSSHKGIGKNTACAILVYAFDQRHVFIETNIRSVFIHHFLRTKERSNDAEILALVDSTLPGESVREWYWALMDYGTYLKSTGNAHLQKTHSYKKQPTFKGSLRELRSTIVRYLLENEKATIENVHEFTKDTRFEIALHGLIDDGLISQTGDYYHLAK